MSRLWWSLPVGLPADEARLQRTVPKEGDPCQQMTSRPIRRSASSSESDSANSSTASTRPRPSSRGAVARSVTRCQMLADLLDPDVTVRLASEPIDLRGMVRIEDAEGFGRWVRAPQPPPA